MTVTIRTLSERIAKQIAIIDNDVSPVYYPNQREIKHLSQLSLSFLHGDLNKLLSQGDINKLEKTKIIFHDLLTIIHEDITKNKRWSFWHYSGLTLITCFAYLQLLKDDKHKTINLADPRVLMTPNWEVATLIINYLAGKLYPKGLSKIQEISEQPDVDIDVLCKTIAKKIKMLS